jgi:hypothetical protein
MTGPVVPNIESLGVGGPEPLHAFGQVCTIGAKQKMVMVIHQNVGKTVDLKALRHLPQGFQKQ